MPGVLTSSALIWAMMKKCIRRSSTTGLTFRIDSRRRRYPIPEGYTRRWTPSHREKRSTFPYVLRSSELMFKFRIESSTTRKIGSAPHLGLDVSVVSWSSF